MADFRSFLFVLESLNDFDLTNNILEENDNIVLFSAVSCYMQRNLNGIHDYFENTVPTYFPDDYKNAWLEKRANFCPKISCKQEEYP